MDEKPRIQALERAQGWLRLPDGGALTGFAHEYTRHGTSTLFAALTAATGQVQAGHYQRRRRGEFLDFMKQVVAAHPAGELHVILDNRSTHKPKDDAWLRAHPRVKLHYTPTHAFGGAVGCGGRWCCFVHSALAAHATQLCPPFRYWLTLGWRHELPEKMSGVFGWVAQRLWGGGMANGWTPVIHRGNAGFSCLRNGWHARC